MANQRRVVLKVSGEQLGSTGEDDFIVQKGLRVCSIIDRLLEKDFLVACVVGGGNIVRGHSLVENGFGNDVVADNMGMIGTTINAIFLRELLKQQGIKARAMSKVAVATMIEPFSYERALKELEAKSAVIIGGGTGQPGVTTDMGVVVAAHQLHCPMVVKTTKVPGVFDKDPEKYDDAKHIPMLNLRQALEDPHIDVMDNAALAYALDHKITISICRPNPDDVIAVLDGDTENGSIVSPS